MIKLKVLVFTLSVSLVAFVGCNSQNKAGKGKLVNEVDSVSYSIGVNIAKIYVQDFESKGLDTVLSYGKIVHGMTDFFMEEDLKIEAASAYGIITKFLKYQEESMKKAKNAQADKNLTEGQKFLEENKLKEGIIVLESGLQYEVLVKGTGPSPGLTDKVSTHYHGTLIDGTVFDSSVDRGEPVQFPVNGVIKGWTEALQLMKTSSKWKLYIPAELAYGERGAGEDIGPNSALVFEIELISINK